MQRSQSCARTDVVVAPDVVVGVPTSASWSLRPCEWQIKYRVIFNHSTSHMVDHATQPELRTHRCRRGPGCSGRGAHICVLELPTLQTVFK